MHVCYKSVGVARHRILNVLSVVNRMRSLWSKAEQAASVHSARFSSLLQTSLDCAVSVVLLAQR